MTGKVLIQVNLIEVWHEETDGNVGLGLRYWLPMPIIGSRSAIRPCRKI